jgi:serine/threonine-protein kinase
VEDVLGEGGMGRVYRALDTKLGRKVALKVIAMAEDDPNAGERKARLLREARAAAALDHPNAVAIFDVGEINGVSFIAMELVTGRLLRRSMRSGDIEWPERVRWLVEIASALAAAHRNGIVHRDIKPDNVMIHSDGRAKVLDFGIARRAEGSADPTASTELSPITVEGGLIGTPLYMAPEQLLGEPLDGRTDQFSWGVLAYELLTGSPPWTGDTMAILSQILAKDPRPIRETRPEIPVEVETTVLRSLARSPRERFDSMDDVVAALAPFASRVLPLSVPPASLPAPEREEATRPIGGTTPDTELGLQTTIQSDSGGKPAAARLSPVKPRQRMLSRSTLVTFGAGLFALALAGGVYWSRNAGFSSSPPPSSSSPPASGPTAVTNLPAPVSASPEVTAAYQLALGELRTGGDATSAFKRAVALDPSLAPAHLQLALLGACNGVDSPTREHFRKAEQLRSQLSERDQALLAAIDPLVRRQPSDWGEATRRMSAALARFPHDAQLWVTLGYFAANGPDYEASDGHFARAIAEDPSYAWAFAVKGENLGYLGRFAESRQALQECNRLVPASVICTLILSRIAMQEGDCEQTEHMARQLIAAGNDPRLGYELLAKSLAAQGKPIPTVNEALKRAWALTAEPARMRDELQGQIQSALWAGDFDVAEQKARELERMVAPSQRQDDHGMAAKWLVQILLETGRTVEAGRMAMDFLARQEALEPDPRAEDFAVAGDVTPLMLATAARAGLMRREELTNGRAAWLARWERKVVPKYKPYLWLQAYAAVTETPDDAREALEMLPKYSPIPPFRPETPSWMGIGPAYWLGGRAEDALSWLEKATKICNGLSFPVEHTRAHAWLGQALEARGDKEGACAAYRVVVERWGEAKRRSVTASMVQSRMKALSCRR